MKKLLASIAILSLVLTVGCTSKNDTDADFETAEGSDPALDLEGAEAAQALDADDFSSDEEVIADGEGLDTEIGAGGEEVVLSDDGSPVTTDEVAATDSAITEDPLAAPPSDFANNDVIGNETSDGSLSSDDMSVFDDSSTDNFASTDSSMEMPADSTPADTSYTDSSYSSDVPTELPPAKVNIPLQKVKDVPYTQAGVLVNAVYIARQGDTPESISQKIYGTDRVQELKSVNSFMNRRDVLVGDKVYYNSPIRPQDNQKLLTFYEDSGIPAQTYLAQDGENIRTLSKKLLGHENSWKEIWSTNLAVESKAELVAGTELRYWPGDVAAPPMPLAENNPPPLPPEIPQDFNTPPPPPPPALDSLAQQDDFSFPDDMNMAGTTGSMEPPPPPPPPATPPQASKSVASDADKDMTFMLSAGGLLLVGVGIILAVMRRSKSRKLSMNTNTQI